MAKNNYKDLSIEELQEKIVTEKKNLQQLRMTHAVSVLENPMKITSTRKAIAQLKTELQNRKSQA